MESGVNPRGRIGYIDCAKGIAILLVIAGHTVFQEPFRGAVFSFHMPLFFILSAMTSRFSTSAEEFLPRFRKSCRHLLPPAVLCWLIGLLYTPLHNMAVSGSPGLDWAPYLESQLLALFWASGVAVKVGSAEFPRWGSSGSSLPFASAGPSMTCFISNSKASPSSPSHWR